MEADISIWRKPGHFYFALTVATARFQVNIGTGVLLTTSRLA